MAKAFAGSEIISTKLQIHNQAKCNVVKDRNHNLKVHGMSNKF